MPLPAEDGTDRSGCAGNFAGALRDGWHGEVIKYGCIKDRKLFDLLEKCGCYENLKEHLTDVIATCVDIKRRVVEEDEFDTGEDSPELRTYPCPHH